MSDSVDILYPDYASVLTFKTSKRKDTAVYTVTCQNEFGKDSADIEVVVLGGYTVFCLLLGYRNRKYLCILFCAVFKDENIIDKIQSHSH